MARRLIVRIGLLAVTTIGVIVLVFLFQFVIPGDPARALFPRSASLDQLESVRQQLHLDDPLWVQFREYSLRVVQGDLGESYVQRRPVSALIAERLPATLALATAGLFIQCVIGLCLGLLAATSQTARRLVPGASLVLLAIPSFVLGLVLLLIFGYGLGIAPVLAGASPSQLVLPALTLGLAGAPLYIQVVTEQTTGALAAPYTRTAVAKGLSNRRIVVRHALRNIASPLVTMLAIDFGVYLSGVVIVEAVFGWPGIGQLAVQSLQKLDRPVVLGIALVAGFAIGVSNLVADLVRMLIDPRTRAGAA